MAFSANGRTQSALSDINITPLVDVVLVLLLIFMVTAPVLQSGIEVAVPQTRTVNQITEEHLIVTIDKDQNVFLQDKPVNIHDLPRLLSSNTAKDAKRVVFVRADRRFPSAPSPPSWTPSSRPASPTSASSRAPSKARTPKPS